MLWLFRGFSPARVDRWFRRQQLVSAALYSLGHGTNDAQKTMGIIAGVLFTAGYLKAFDIPFWVVIAAHLAIALGTLSGGWRIVHTMGSKITRLQPFGGFAAETAGAITLFTASSFGIPVSTTHTITGAIVGVGAVRPVRGSLGRRRPHRLGVGPHHPGLGHHRCPHLRAARADRIAVGRRVRDDGASASRHPAYAVTVGRVPPETRSIEGGRAGG